MKNLIVLLRIFGLVCFALYWLFNAISPAAIVHLNLLLLCSAVSFGFAFVLALVNTSFFGYLEKDDDE